MTRLLQYPIKIFGNNHAKQRNLKITFVKNFCFNPFQNKPLFLHVCNTCLLKTLWEKEKLLIMSNNSLFPPCFLPLLELSATFIKFKIVVANSSSLDCIVFTQLSTVFQSLRRQLTLFMSFLGFTSTRLGPEVSCPRTLPRKNPESSLEESKIFRLGTG